MQQAPYHECPIGIQIRRFYMSNDLSVVYYFSLVPIYRLLRSFMVEIYCNAGIKYIRNPYSYDGR